MNLDNIPSVLTEKREVIECNWIFCLYKEPDRIPDYKNVENGTDIITEDGMFYYGLAVNMNKAGYNVFDDMSIYTYLEDKETLKNGYDRRGGYNTIKEILDVISSENIDSFYDELVKNNLLIRLNEAGFNVVDNYKKFTNMSSSDVYDYYEYVLSNISLGKVEKIHIEDLSDPNAYIDAITEWDKGNDRGFRIASGMLNYQLIGVHKKNLMLHLSGIGFGKTTSAIYLYILPALEDGVNVTILANEQDVDAWRKMVLSTVLFNKIGKVEKFSRHQMTIGSYTQEQIAKMSEAAEWLANQPGKLSFVELNNYDITNVKKIITRQAKIGNELFLFDTMKGTDDSAQNQWGVFSEVAKELFLLAKHLDVAIIATAQLSPDAMARRFLDLTCIGRARSIAETANSVVMFRPIAEDEKEKIKGYNWDGKIKREVLLEKDKQYICVYTPKNRYGQVSPQIIMERNLNFNTYKDVCWWECPYDNFSRR